MRNASSIAAIAAVLLVAFTSKFDRAMTAATAAEPPVATSAVGDAVQTKPIVVAQFNPCPNGRCIR
jgi:hypothetical protein